MHNIASKMNHGSLIISLDFELMWGLIDVMSKNGYGQSNVKQVPQVIDRMIDLFEKYGVHATFATVGFIMYKDKKSLFEDVPTVLPTYEKTSCSPYENKYINNITKNEECLFFQPNIVERLKLAEGIEIATHTYCHYYCLEKGQTTDQFDVDIQKAMAVAKRNGIELKSIVFPRNQVSKEHLKICAKYGISSFRGDAPKYFSETKNELEHMKNRICRFFDAYFNIGGMNGCPYDNIDVNEAPINLRASRMLRPYSPQLSFLEGLRLKRIKKEMIHAAKNNEMYHLWWHPHNFGVNMEENFAFLEKVLKCYQECHEKYGMQSYTMNELTEQLKK